MSDFVAGQAGPWDLDDLAQTGDIAAALGVTKPTVSNWPRRHADFPAPLRELSGGLVYSMRQVRAWHEARWPGWTAG